MSNEDEFASFDDDAPPSRPSKVRGSAPPNRLKKVSKKKSTSRSAEEDRPARSTSGRSTSGRASSAKGRASSARGKRGGEEEEQQRPSRRNARKKRQQFYLYPMVAVCLLSAIVTVSVVGCEVAKSITSGQAVTYWNKNGLIPLPELVGDKNVSAQMAWDRSAEHLRPQDHATLGAKHADGAVFYLKNGGDTIALLEVAWYNKDGQRVYEVVHIRNMSKSPEKLYAYKKVVLDNGIEELRNTVPQITTDPKTGNWIRVHNYDDE